MKISGERAKGANSAKVLRQNVPVIFRGWQRGQYGSGTKAVRWRAIGDEVRGPVVYFENFGFPVSELMTLCKILG